MKRENDILHAVWEMCNDMQIVWKISSCLERTKNGKSYKWAGRSTRSLPEMLLVPISISQCIVTKTLCFS
jgi:hypothetical protein